MSANSKSPSYLCAVCRSKLPPVPSRNLSTRTHIQILLITLVFCGLISVTLSTWAGIKSSLIYLPLFISAEWIQWLKIRDALKCKTCHFDPMLYKRDWRLARKQIEARMHQLSEDLQEKIRLEISRIAGPSDPTAKNPPQLKASVEETALETAEKVAKMAKAEIRNGSPEKYTDKSTQ